MRKLFLRIKNAYVSWKRGRAEARYVSGWNWAEDEMEIGVEPQELLQALDMAKLHGDADEFDKGAYDAIGRYQNGLSFQ